MRTRDSVKAFSYICLGCAQTEIIENESADEDEEDEELIEQKKKDDAVSDFLFRERNTIL